MQNVVNFRFILLTFQARLGSMQEEKCLLSILFCADSPCSAASLPPFGRTAAVPLPEQQGLQVIFPAEQCFATGSMVRQALVA
jgi:hypothetical protein